jgi:hypothetical protein
MNTRLLTDLALAPLAGYVGTKLMEPVSSKLHELESEHARRREDEARPGMPYAIAARKAADLVGLRLSDRQHERLALAFHYGWRSSGRRCTRCSDDAHPWVLSPPGSPRAPRCRWSPTR